ncbi:transposase [Amycolatopsis sp. cmx-11-12]|uniref:transposase n=1 Tax=Amycolatopsis sp. cmx-11-12 TaxID=2785795 RepID=UPI0039186523
MDVDGRKHALGLSIADNEAAKFWAKVATDLRNRGPRGILITCCDGLTGAGPTRYVILLRHWPASPRG